MNYSEGPRKNIKPQISQITQIFNIRIICGKEVKPKFCPMIG